MSSELGGTIIKKAEQFQDRWNAFGTNSGILEISEKLSSEKLKKFDLFKEYDDKFLDKISQDVTVATWASSSVLFEEGTYIDLAFFIVQGEVEIYIDKLQERPKMNQPMFNPFRTRLFDQQVDLAPPKKRNGIKKKVEKKPLENPLSQTILQTQFQKQGTDATPAATPILFLSTMDFNMPAAGRMRLGKGEIFGEIGALSGWPQSVTARTSSECVLLQVRLPALRAMKRKSPALKKRIDEIYRERSLSSQLKSTPLLEKCDDRFIESLKDKVELISCSSDEAITTQGEPANELYLVRSGFVKLTQKFGESEIVVSYLSKGMTLGETELLLNEIDTWQHSAYSVENTELIKIDKKNFTDLIQKFPYTEELLWKSTVARTKESGASRKNVNQSEFINTALSKGLVEGNSILVIDLNTCTRCDDCVRGCASTHDGRPRFVREGDKYENFLITRACYHCEDPVCLVGCPTGAIRRASVGQVVEIIDDICIGCTACSRSCPYDAITMHDMGDLWPDNALPAPNRGKPHVIASKCDLCYKTEHGPACENNCPHGCAIRVKSIEEFQQLLSNDE